MQCHSPLPCSPIAQRPMTGKVKARVGSGSGGQPAGWRVRRSAPDRRLLHGGPVKVIPPPKNQTASEPASPDDRA